MDELICNLNDELNLSFNMQISGTSQTVSEVRVVLGKDVKVTNLAKFNNGNYESSIMVSDKFFKAGTELLSIEIILNGKIFTPLKRMITILPSDTETTKEEIQPKILEAKEVITQEIIEEILTEIKEEKVVNTFQIKIDNLFDIFLPEEEEEKLVKIKNKKVDNKPKLSIKFDQKPTVVKKFIPTFESIVNATPPKEFTPIIIKKGSTFTPYSSAFRLVETGIILR